MPVKKGKAKGKSKGKGKKGKGKGKKKGQGKLEKREKEAMMREALSNAKLWEARYQAAEKSRQEYRENTRRIVIENERMQNAVNQTERDTVEVIAFLKREDTRKDEELSELKQQVKEVRQDARREREGLIGQHSEQVTALEGLLGERNEEVRTMQNELKMVREFRKKRGEMQQQLDQMRTTLEVSNHEHKTAVSHMEQKFFEEKLRLQKEANRRIADLAKKAHAEAMSNLDERTREVYRENIHMAEALSLHMEHEATLRKGKEQLEMANRQLVAEKELNQQMVKEKIAQARHHKKLIKELQEKVQGLEQSLGVVVREFEEEKRRTEERHHEHLQLASSELVSLRRHCELQSREMNHVKRLARHILDQRSEMEQFFLESLTFVKKKIAANRAQYKHDAQVLYQRRMLNATRGEGGFPAIRTFRPLETSTNSVYHDMEQAERWEGVEGHVDISELTWEQREQVLRLLFSKMNASRPPVRPHTSLPQLPAPRKEEGEDDKQHQQRHRADGDTVFLTQQDTQTAPSASALVT